MPSKADLEARIARDLARKDLDSITLANIRDAVQAAPVPLQQDLLASIRRGRPKSAGGVLVRMVVEHLSSARQTEAAAMLADDTLSLAELNRWLD